MKKTPFILWSQGRLGNLMFQYAFCHAAAKRLGRKFIFVTDDNGEFRRFFHLGSPYEIAFLDRLWGRNALKIKQKIQNTFSIPVHWSNEEIIKWLSNKHFISGYFQGEAFFSGLNCEIKDIFQTNEWAQKEYAASIQKIGLSGKENNLAVVHVRRQDYATFGSPELGGADLRLPSSWYKKAADLAASVQHIEQALVITDDPEWCKKSLHLPWPTHVISQSPTTDFMHLMHGRVCIVSNSSFAWWGAWLNKTPQKMVIAPQCWLGFKTGMEMPPGIIPDTWKKI